MHDRPKVLQQDKNAILVSYVAYRIWLAIITYGILAIYDFLSYKNAKLRVHDTSVELSGALPSSSKIIEFKDISGFSIKQSVLGKKANYGTVKIHHSDGAVHSFKFVHDPAKVAYILHKKVSLINSHIFAATEYAQKQADELAAKNAEQVKRAGTCPRCGSDNLQAITESRTRGVSVTGSTAGCCCLGPIGLLCGLPGAGASSSRTRRMCLNCGKKF
jgi:hypothetical protein